MGFFGDIKDFFGSGVTWVVRAGGKVLTAAVDLENMTVSLADEVWRAIPGELLAPGRGPLAGLLKSEVEDELFMMLGPQGLVVGLGVFPVSADRAAGSMIGGLALVHAIRHRQLHDKEWRMAQWMFGGQLPPRNNIRLTNMGVPKKDGGLFDRAIVFPAIGNQYYVNLGAGYRQNGNIDGPLLMHELTHVWQGRNKVIRDLQMFVAATNRKYDYKRGKQWRNYGLEQQAAIVGDFARGTIENGRPLIKAVSPLSLSSPLFRYIRANLRTNANTADSTDAKTVRGLVGATTKTLRLSDIHPPAPERWW